MRGGCVKSAMQVLSNGGLPGIGQAMSITPQAERTYSSLYIREGLQDMRSDST